MYFITLGLGIHTKQIRNDHVACVWCVRCASRVCLSIQIRKSDTRHHFQRAPESENKRKVTHISCKKDEAIYKIHRRNNNRNNDDKHVKFVDGAAAFSCFLDADILSTRRFMGAFQNRLFICKRSMLKSLWMGTRYSSLIRHKSIEWY